MPDHKHDYQVTDQPDAFESIRCATCGLAYPEIPEEGVALPGIDAEGVPFDEFVRKTVLKPKTETHISG